MALVRKRSDEDVLPPLRQWPMTGQTVGTRDIFLVRHAQCKQDQLTELGRAQIAQMTKALSSVTFDRIVSTSCPRVQTTTDLIVAGLPFPPPLVDVDESMADGAPHPPFNTPPRIADDDPDPPCVVEFDAKCEPIDEAFERHFLESTAKCQLIVCRSSIMRYFMCRAMHFDGCNWRGFTVKPPHTGIVHISVDAAGIPRGEPNLVHDDHLLDGQKTGRKRVQQFVCEMY